MLCNEFSSAYQLQIWIMSFSGHKNGIHLYHVHNREPFWHKRSSMITGPAKTIGLALVGCALEKACCLWLIKVIPFRHI